MSGRIDLRRYAWPALGAFVVLIFFITIAKTGINW